MTTTCCSLTDVVWKWMVNSALNTRFTSYVDCCYWLYSCKTRRDTLHKKYFCWSSRLIFLIPKPLLWSFQHSKQNLNRLKRKQWQTCLNRSKERNQLAMAHRLSVSSSLHFFTSEFVIMKMFVQISHNFSKLLAKRTHDMTCFQWYSSILHRTFRG